MSKSEETKSIQRFTILLIFSIRGRDSENGVIPATSYTRAISNSSASGERIFSSIFSRLHTSTNSENPFIVILEII